MRRLFLVSAIVLALGVMLAGCSKKTETATNQTSTDSLLATNPVEQPQGNMTPSQQYQGTPAEQQTPPEPAPAPTQTRHHPTTHHHPSDNSGSAAGTSAPESRGVTVAAGTPVDVVLHTALSSKTAQVGDTWTGEVKDNVIVGNIVVIPAGSTVTGVVNTVESAEAAKAEKEKKTASLGLAVKSVTVNGQEHALTASTEPIVAGSARARNIGAVAGGAAAGALIGHAAGGGKGTLIGGLVGGGLAALGAAKSSGYQVVTKDGMDITFHVDEPVTLRE